LELIVFLYSGNLMPLNEFKKTAGHDPRFRTNEIRIIGPSRFQNSLMAAILTRDLEIPCFCDATLEPVHLQADRHMVILCDGLGNGTLRELFESLGAEYEQLHPYCLVAFFNVGRDSKIVYRETLARGVRGIFFENEPLERFLKGIRSIMDGEYWFSRDLLNRWVPEARRPKEVETQPVPLLTRREKEILLMVASGASNEEISDKLTISYHTVKTHISNIYKKIDAPNRLQASLWAAKNI